LLKTFFHSKGCFRVFTVEDGTKDIKETKTEVKLRKTENLLFKRHSAACMAFCDEENTVCSTKDAT